MIERKDIERREPEIVYSRSLKAGKRLYYLDVKKARNEDLYLCITESKRRQAGEDEFPTFEKHKVFLYKEDFEGFKECLQDVISYVEKQFGTIDRREEYVPEAKAEQPVEAGHEVDSGAAQDEPAERRSFFQRIGLKD